MKIEYTVGQLAELAGVSRRTLRYYDRIGLLAPAGKNNSGYRIYGEKEVDLLQQILFFKSLEIPLSQIRSIVGDPAFDPAAALKSHHKKLLAARNRLDVLVKLVEETISYQKGETDMSDEQKFEAFKKQSVENNEKHYGQETRALYGNEAVEQGNRQFMQLSRKDHARMEEIERELISLLTQAFSSGEITEKMSLQVYQLHAAWLAFTWREYSAEAHRGLADMYARDRRFAAYYNEKAGCEVTPILCRSILKHSGHMKD